MDGFVQNLDPLKIQSTIAVCLVAVYSRAGAPSLQFAKPKRIESVGRFNKAYDFSGDMSFKVRIKSKFVRINFSML